MDTEAKMSLLDQAEFVKSTAILLFNTIKKTQIKMPVTFEFQDGESISIDRSVYANDDLREVKIRFRDWDAVVGGK